MHLGLLLVQFLLKSRSVGSLTLSASLNCNVTWFTRARLSHLGTTGTRYWKTLRQIAGRVDLLMMINSRTCTLRCIIVRHVGGLCPGYSRVDLRLGWVPDGRADFFLLAHLTIAMYQTLMVNRLIDSLRLSDPIVGAISWLLFFHGILTHSGCLFARCLRFLDTLTTHLRVHHAWVLLNMGLVVLSWRACHG